MGRLAFMPVVLLVASVDDPAVLVGAVPELGSEESSALAAFYLAGENAHAAVPAALSLAPRHFRLHHLEGGRVCLCQVKTKNFFWKFLARPCPSSNRGQ